MLKRQSITDVTRHFDVHPHTLKRVMIEESKRDKQPS